MRVATALGVLWLCLAGEGSRVGPGGGGGGGDHSHQVSLSSRAGEVLANLLPISSLPCPPRSYLWDPTGNLLYIFSLCFLFGKMVM